MRHFDVVFWVETNTTHLSTLRTSKQHVPCPETNAAEYSMSKLDVAVPDQLRTILAHLAKNSPLVGQRLIQLCQDKSELIHNICDSASAAAAAARTTASESARPYTNGDTNC